MQIERVSEYVCCVCKCEKYAPLEMDIRHDVVTVFASPCFLIYYIIRFVYTDTHIRGYVPHFSLPLLANFSIIVGKKQKENSDSVECNDFSISIVTEKSFMERTRLKIMYKLYIFTSYRVRSVLSSSSVCSFT